VAIDGRLPAGRARPRSAAPSSSPRGLQVQPGGFAVPTAHPLVTAVPVILLAVLAVVAGGAAGLLLAGLPLLAGALLAAAVLLSLFRGAFRRRY